MKIEVNNFKDTIEISAFDIIEDLANEIAKKKIKKKVKKIKTKVKMKVTKEAEENILIKHLEKMFEMSMEYSDISNITGLSINEIKGYRNLIVKETF